MTYYSRDELDELGLACVGSNVKISRKASIYGADRISIGENSRIDDFCILSAGVGGINIGSFVHVGAMATMIGEGRIDIGDFSGLSGRVSVYSSSDDYSGRHMTNPTVPKELTLVDQRDVSIGRHVILGAGSIVLPGAIIEDGVAIGALSVAKGHLAGNAIYAGAPAKLIGPRDTGMYLKERRVDSAG